MKQCRFLAMLLIAATLAFSSCGGGGSGDGNGDTVIDIAVISGIAMPNYSETPVTVINETAQYTGTVTWSSSPVTFAATTVYTATIELTAKTGYTFNGIAANFFKVAGATATNAADSGVIIAVFPATGSVPPAVINMSAISGVAMPNYGETPVAAITETAQYTGTVTWSSSPVAFAATTVYTATIALTAKTGYTLHGVPANFFKVAGAITTNGAGSCVVVAVFPTTGSVPPTVINIAAISGVTAPVLGAEPVTTITEMAQYIGTVNWDGGWAWSSRFGGQKAYTATITLTAKTGYTLKGVAGNFFTVSGASTAATNSANSGVITAVFPATASVGAIGDSALGGKVAYILQSGDNGYVTGEQRGLIAATEDQGSGMKWAVDSYLSTAVPYGTGTALGAGFVNTNRIVAQNGTGVTYAAGLARAYNGGGYTDWYLPSKDELRKLYLNRAVIGGFSALVYWSSSEVNSGSAWYNGFDFNNWFESEKVNVARVRAVRSF